MAAAPFISSLRQGGAYSYDLYGVIQDLWAGTREKLHKV